VSDFSVQGRMAQGVKLVRLSEGATLVSVSVCEGEEAAEAGPEAGTESETKTETP
jgi:hypothetical protein